MKAFRILPLLVATFLLIPQTTAYAADPPRHTESYGITVAAVGAIPEYAVANARKAAVDTAAYLAENGVYVSRDIPRTIRLYETPDLFVNGMAEGGAFGQPVDEEKFNKEKDGWKKYGGTITKNTLHINLSIFRKNDTATLTHVVSHEFTHLIQYELTGYGHSTDHRWLVEGTAELVAFAVTRRFPSAIGGIIADLETQKSLPSLTKLADADRFSETLETIDKHSYKIVYGVSTLATWYLLTRTRKPLKSLFDYMTAYRESPLDRKGNFAKTFGLTTADFYTLFDKYLGSIKKRLRPVNP